MRQIKTKQLICHTAVEVVPCSFFGILLVFAFINKSI